MPQPAEVRFNHHVVFRRPEAFAGWPANYGLWSWGPEVLCVFVVGRVGPKGEIHEIDREHAIKPWQARSLDGGTTWTAEPFPGRVPGGASLSADEHLEIEMKIRPLLNPARDLDLLVDAIDFLDPETIVLCARTGLTETSVSWFYVSRSRGKQWAWPFAFSGLRMSLSARTDVVPLGRHEALFMLTTVKADGREGRVFCARTTDGGRTFAFVSYLGREPDGYRIMPSSVRLGDGAILTATRCADQKDRGWIEVYTSPDRGVTWTELAVAVENTGTDGNPPALALMGVDKLALAYGYRGRPYGMRMRLSDCGGKSWGDEMTLRADGGNADIGYPTVVALSANELLSVYYFNDGEGTERYIAATRVVLSDLPGAITI